MLSAGSAHARPSFGLTDASARAGDVVHFSITEPGGWGVAYHLEVADEDVLDGRQAGAVSGTFTMPYLGESAKTVFVEAELWWSDNKRREKRRLEYLGPALPAPDPPAPPPTSTVQALIPQTAAPAPVVAPQTAATPVPAPAPAHSAAPDSRRPLRRGAESRAAEPRQAAARSDERRRGAHRTRAGEKRDARKRHRRSKRSRRFQGGFYRGYAESTGGARWGGGKFFALNAIAPHSATLAAGAARSGGAFNTAVAVPALLAAGALTLAGTAMLRRRRLASRSGRG